MNKQKISQVKVLSISAIIALSVVGFGISIAANYPPTAPQNLIANTQSDTSIFLDWDEPATTNGGITRYNIEMESPIGGGFSEIAEIEGGQAINGTWQYRESKWDDTFANMGFSSIPNAIFISGGSTAQQSEGVVFKTFPTSFLNNTNIVVDWSGTTLDFSGQSMARLKVLNAEYVRNNFTQFPATNNFGVVPSNCCHTVSVETTRGYSGFPGVMPRTTDTVSWVTLDGEFSTIFIHLEDPSISEEPRLNIFSLNITDQTTGSTKAFYNFTGVTINPEVTATQNDYGTYEDNNFVTQFGIPPTTEFTGIGLTPKTEYNFRVNAENVFGASTYSNTTANTTFGVPDAPTSLTSNTISSSQIDLSWTTPADFASPITGYKIERESPVGSGFATIVADTSSTSTVFSDTGLATSTQYNYRVSAINSFGTGPASNEANVTTQVESSVVTLSAEKDSFLRAGDKNTNEGANEVLQIQGSGQYRTLVAFNQTEIESAAGGLDVINATLRLYIEDNANNWSPSGRTIDIHKLAANWVEGNGWNVGNNIRGTGSGVTWNCAIDTDISNPQANCNPTWNGGNFVSTTTDSMLITNGLVYQFIEFDVTADVQAFLDGTGQNNGWIIKKTQDSQSGSLDFTSREGTTNNPELVIFFG